MHFDEHETIDMSTFERALESLTEAEVLVDDRRYDDRIKCLKHIRVRGVDSSREEVGTMTDLSRDGLFFTVRSHDYRVGMELWLSINDAAWMCEVVRIELLPSGSTGVGVRILR